MIRADLSRFIHQFDVQYNSNIWINNSKLSNINLIFRIGIGRYHSEQSAIVSAVQILHLYYQV